MNSWTDSVDYITQMLDYEIQTDVGNSCFFSKG